MQGEHHPLSNSELGVLPVESVTQNPSAPVLLETENSEKLSAEELREAIDAWFPSSIYMSTAIDPENSKQYLVVDLGKIQAKLLERFWVHKNKANVAVSREKVARVFFERHLDDEVLVPEQVARGQFEPKPLFYSPASIEDATDVVEIADAKFHIALWDLDKNSVLSNRDSKYPTVDGSDLASFEAKFALKVFHPKYGDGRRKSSDDKLYLKNPDYDPKDPESAKRVPFGRDILKKYGLFNTAQRKLSGQRTPGSRSLYEGLETECPHLILNGAIRREDIRQLSITSTGEVSTTFEKEIGATPYIMLRGVNQYVGRRFAGCKVSAFGDSKALIIDDQGDDKVLRAIFTIVSKGNASEVYVGGNGNKIPRANADKTQLIEIDYNKLVPNGSDGKTGVLLEQKRKEVAVKITQAVRNLLEVAAESEALVRNEIEASEIELQTIIKDVRSVLLNQAERAIVLAASVPDLAQLENGLKSTEASAQAFVALMKSSGVEKMVRKPLDVVNAKELTTLDREQMRLLLQENYKAAYPGEEQVVFRQKIAESLEAAFGREETNFYLLKDGAKIISFNRFDANIDTEDGRVVLYFGSFNADSKYRGVGGSMLEHTIQEKLQECNVMQAHCDPSSDISKKYIEDGFVATNTETVAGKFSFEIWRSYDSSEQLVTKGMSIPELLASIDNPLSDSFFVRPIESQDKFHELDEGLGYALTRYFTVKGVTYAAFEIPSSKLYNRFAPARKSVIQKAA